jgi:hypothetical protein
MGYYSVGPNPQNVMLQGMMAGILRVGQPGSQ